MESINAGLPSYARIVDVDFSLENMSNIDKLDLIMIKSAITYCAKDIAGFGNNTKAVIRTTEAGYGGIQLKSYRILVRFPLCVEFNDQHFMDIKMINIHRFWDKIKNYYCAEPPSMMLEIPVDSNICPINTKNFSFSMINMQSPRIMILKNGKEDDDDNNALRRNRNQNKKNINHITDSDEEEEIGQKNTKKRKL